MASGDLREATGPFEVGTTILSTPVGIDTLVSTITELEPGRTLAVQSGPAVDAQGPIAGPRISDDYPAALKEIIDVASQRR